jgi:hypothetical protein
MRPIVAVLTDFGTRDSYAGALKGAVLAACPEASVVDISHDVARHDVTEASWVLFTCYQAFPAGTVFLVVIDPGVGSSRRALAIQAGGYSFVGPDNGVLGLICGDSGSADVHEITNRGLFRYDVSATFHGRDVFAPVAGLLARGISLDEVGPAISDPVGAALATAKNLGSGAWEAEVVHVDIYGNMTTAFTRHDVAQILDVVGGDMSQIVAVVGELVVPLIDHYSEVSEGEPCALLGSSGRVELAVNRGSAAEELRGGTGTKVVLRPVSAA